ncbi:replication initiation protein [Galenea microaerophila]
MTIAKIMSNLNTKITSKGEFEENKESDEKNTCLARNLEKSAEGANVKMSNALVSAIHGLNLSERRLIFLGMALLEKGDEIQISAKEYAEVFGLDKANAYKQISDACNKLFEREIRFLDGRKTTRYRWVQCTSYHEGEGWCTLKFTDIVCKNIKGLQTQYTRYALAKAGNLKSIYSWRLMERFLQYGNSKKDYKGWWQISIVELCEFLELSDFYLEWRRLREKILIPATNELMKKDNWVITFTPLKTGRKTTHVKFDFKQDKKIK